MITSYPSSRSAESLLTVVNHPSAGPAQSPSAVRTVAISREAETGGPAVAHEIGARLGWRVYDHELLQRIASDLGVRAELLQRVDEQRGDWLREAFESLMGVPYVAESVYVHRLVKVVLALGAIGDCVIVGRGAPFVLPAATTFRVRLVAPREFRVSALRRRLGLDEAAAQAMLTAQDRERVGFVRDHFCRDSEEPHHYDLTLNVARFTPGECAEMVVDGLRRCRDRDFGASER